MKFDLTKKWGVEIEFTGGDRSAIALALRAAGLEAHVEGWNHNTRRHWKVITDASCGYELVSPPLMGEEGLRDLKIAMNVLANSPGVRVDRRCGLHIHHDAVDLTVKEMRIAMALYMKYEGVIDMMHPPSRRRGCNYASDYYFDKDNSLKKIKVARSIERLKEVFGSSSQRFRKVNLRALERHGTIEFRQHAGSLNFEKVKHWLVFTQGLLRRGIDKGTTFKQGPISWYKLRNALGFGKDEHTHKALRFLGKRIRHFEERERVVA